MCSYEESLFLFMLLDLTRLSLPYRPKYFSQCCLLHDQNIIVQYFINTFYSRTDPTPGYLPRSNPSVQGAGWLLVSTDISVNHSGQIGVNSLQFVSYPDIFVCVFHHIMVKTDFSTYPVVYQGWIVQIM